MIEINSGGETEGASEGVVAVKTFEMHECVVKGVDTDSGRQDRMTAGLQHLFRFLQTPKWGLNDKK